MVLSEPPSCVGTPRSRRVWFPVKILHCLYTARTRSVSEPLPWVRNTKIGNNMVLSESPSCVGTPRSRRVWFPAKSSLDLLRSSLDFIQQGWGQLLRSSLDFIQQGWGQLLRSSLDFIQQGWGQLLRSSLDFIQQGWCQLLRSSLDFIQQGWCQLLKSSLDFVQQGWDQLRIVHLG